MRADQRRVAARCALAWSWPQLRGAVDGRRRQLGRRRTGRSEALNALASALLTGVTIGVVERLRDRRRLCVAARDAGGELLHAPGVKLHVAPTVELHSEGAPLGFGARDRAALAVLDEASDMSATHSCPSSRASSS